MAPAGHLWARVDADDFSGGGGLTVGEVLYSRVLGGRFEPLVTAWMCEGMGETKAVAGGELQLL